MIDFLMNAALLVLGCAGSLVAIGGDTWTKGEQKLLHRITLRGWFAISCLLLALFVGVVKEVHTSRTAAAAQEQLVEAREKMNDISQAAAVTKNALEETRLNLDKTSQTRADAEKKLNDALVMINAVTNSHSRTLEEAKEQVVKLRDAQRLSEERYYGLASFSRPDQQIAKAIDLDYDEPLVLFGGEVVSFNNHFRGFLALQTEDWKTGQRQIYKMPPGAYEIKLDGQPGEPLLATVAKAGGGGFGAGSIILKITSADPRRHERRAKAFEGMHRIPMARVESKVE